MGKEKAHHCLREDQWSSNLVNEYASYRWRRSSSEKVLREIEEHPELQLLVVGLVDDNKHKLGSTLRRKRFWEIYTCPDYRCNRCRKYSCHASVKGEYFDAFVILAPLESRSRPSCIWEMVRHRQCVPSDVKSEIVSVTIQTTIEVWSLSQGSMGWSQVRRVMLRIGAPNYPFNLPCYSCLDR